MNRSGKPAKRGRATKTGHGRLAAIAAAVVALAAIVAFLPVRNHELVDWDDFQNLRDNEHIRGFSPENVVWMLTAAHLGVWQPVAWIVTTAEYVAFGGEDDGALSRGMHAANVVLHAVTAVLLLFLLRRLLLLVRPKEGARAPDALTLAAAGGALLFAVHPLRVELVAWATAQPYILAVGFALASLLFYLRAAASGGGRDLVLSYVFFALSLLSKSIGVPLAALFPILDAYPLRRFEGDGPLAARSRGVWIEKIPFFLLAAAVVVIAPLAKGSAASTMSWGVHGPLQRLAQSCYGLVFYAWKTLVPTGLSPIYELRLPLVVTAPKYLVSMGIVAAGAALAGALVRTRWKGVSVALVSYALLLLPVLGFLQSGNQEVADRYAYLPAVPLAALAAALLFRLFRAGRSAAWAAAAATIAVAAAFGVLTEKQCAVWKDTASLWTRAAELQPASSVAQNGYGYVLLQRGDIEGAIPRFRRAIALKADNEMAHRNLWEALRSTWNTDATLEALRESTRMLPNFAEAHHHLGNEYARRGQWAAAAACFRRALEIDPNLAISHRSLAGVLFSSGDREGAERHARRALELDSMLNDARIVLAQCLHDKGQDAEARAALRDVLRYDPGNASARLLLDRWAGPAAP